MEEGELTYFYTDDYKKVQGPFAASLIERWIGRGMLPDGIETVITDNGKRTGKLFTIEATIGELKQRFRTVPTKICEISMRGNVLLNEDVEEVLQLMPSSSLKAEEPVESAKREDLPNKSWSPSLIRSSGRDYPDEPNRRDNSAERIKFRLNTKPLKQYAAISLKLDDSDSDWESEGHEPPSPRRNFKAGPILPPERDEQKKSDHIGKIRRESSSGARMSSPYSKDQENRSPKKEQKDQHQYLPFYHGSSAKGNTVLPKVVAVEFAVHLQNMYVKLDKKEREKVHRAWERIPLPKKCRACSCELGQPTNYLSHVLSKNHITKSMDKKNLQFTFEQDYEKMKKLMQHSKLESMEDSP